MSLGPLSACRLSATVSPGAGVSVTTSVASPYSVAPGISATDRTWALRLPTGRITSKWNCGMRLPYSSSGILSMTA